MEKGKENANRQKNMLDTVKINHVQHISFTQSRLTDAVSVILSELLSYEHPSKRAGALQAVERARVCSAGKISPHQSPAATASPQGEAFGENRRRCMPTQGGG